MKAIENGQPVPADLFDTYGLDPSIGRNIQRYLRSGLSLMGIGLGLTFLLYWFYDNDMSGAGIGLLVFFIGLGKVAYYYAARHELDRHKNDTPKE
jgi:hypothetical protein